MQLDSESDTSPFEAVEALRAREGISRIDVVIANAGVGPIARLEDTTTAQIHQTVQVNGIAVLLLYQATLPLLREAATAGATAAGVDAPKFAVISSGGGSIAHAATSNVFPLGLYGASKALANFFVVKMGAENDWLVTLCIDPG